MTRYQIEQLRKHSQSVKLRLLKMSYDAQVGHIGCSLSCADILTFVRFSLMSGNDRLILSKGHAAAALYSVFAEAGDISPELLSTFCQDGTILAAHPPPRKFECIPFATGSLGHGLSLAAGLALGALLNRTSETFFCVSSDGELDEGSTWEAALFVAHHQLQRVMWIIDRNKIQAFGRTEQVLALEPLRQKLEAFNWKVQEADGHDFSSLLEAKRELTLGSSQDRRPSALICHTIKGYGVSVMADRLDSHYLPIRDQQEFLNASFELTSKACVNDED